MTNIDWASLKQTADDSTKPVPPGRYDVGITSAEHKTASTGAPMIVTKLRVIGGPSDGKTLFHNFVLTVDSPFALKMFFDAMAAFGITVEVMSQFGDNIETAMPRIAQVLVGRQASAEVTVRTWNGQERNNLGGFQMAYGLAGQPAVGNIQPGVPSVPGVPSPSPTAVPTPTPNPSPTIGGMPAIGVSPTTPPPGLPV